MKTRDIKNPNSKMFIMSCPRCNNKVKIKELKVEKKNE